MSKSLSIIKLVEYVSASFEIFKTERTLSKEEELLALTSTNVNH